MITAIIKMTSTFYSPEDLEIIIKERLLQYLSPAEKDTIKIIKLEVTDTTTSEIERLEVQVKQCQGIIDNLKDNLHKLSIINTYLYHSLKDSDETICELCKQLNPQHVSMDYGKGCTTCKEREVRLRILAKAEEMKE